MYYLNMKLKDVDEKTRRHLEILQNEVQRSNSIITDLLYTGHHKEVISYLITSVSSIFTQLSLDCFFHLFLGFSFLLGSFFFVGD